MLARSLWIRAMSPRAALQTLGISASTDMTHSRLKKAYVAQTLRCHPDLNPDDPDATEKFRNLSEALRVALKTLETRCPSEDGRKRVSVDDSQSALDALRHAIAAYHSHKSAAGVESSDGSSDSSTDPLLFPTLEYLASVCQKEAVAMQRVRRFCDELPEVLCGKSCVLFEAVTFFNPRCVEAMSRCVLRFSKNLPIIVARVVKNRKKYVRHTHNKANSGVGTGVRPRQQRIEDMVMKPLVLMGALVFNQKQNVTPASGGTENDRNNNETVNPRQDIGEKSTCGAHSPDELKISEELKCTIYPSDSIADITEKICKWEAASFARLQLELAMVDTTSLLSGMLDLNEHSLAIMSHLHLPKKTSEKVSLTLQKLLCGLCLYSEEPSGHSEDNSGGTDKAMQFIRLISQCRSLAGRTASYIEGNITITWDAQIPLVESAEDVAVSNDDFPSASPGVEGNDTQCNGFKVVRHMSCCTAEMIRFSVSVELSKDLFVFLLRLSTALGYVLEQAEFSNSLLPQLIKVRDVVVKEEFIPINTINDVKNNSKIDDSMNNKNTSDEATTLSSLTMSPTLSDVSGEDEKDEGQEYSYRGPIRCFPRVFSMPTKQEFVVWQYLHEHRVYLAQHAPAMNPINVYYNSLPYKPLPQAQHNENHSLGDDILGGWVGESDEGVDDAVLTSRELENTSVFREWLEEVVEQSSLNRECHRILSEAGVGYVTRDHALPLPQYLSFVKVFCASVAVRGVLESEVKASRTATPEDTGLIIVVGTECDMRDGGRLLVPWWMDPTLFLALLNNDADNRHSLLESGFASAGSS